MSRGEIVACRVRLIQITHHSGPFNTCFQSLGGELIFQPSSRVGALKKPRNIEIYCFGLWISQPDRLDSQIGRETQRWETSAPTGRPRVGGFTGNCGGWKLAPWVINILDEGIGREANRLWSSAILSTLADESLREIYHPTSSILFSAIGTSSVVGLGLWSA